MFELDETWWSLQIFSSFGFLLYRFFDPLQWSQVIPNDSYDVGCVVFIKWYPPAIVLYVLSLAPWVSFYKSPLCTTASARWHCGRRGRDWCERCCAQRHQRGWSQNWFIQWVSQAVVCWCDQLSLQCHFIIPCHFLSPIAQKGYSNIEVNQCLTFLFSITHLAGEPKMPPVVKEESSALRNDRTRYRSACSALLYEVIQAHYF